MKLKDLILEILKRGGKFKSREIARRATILDDGILYSKEDVKEIIFKELNQIVNYDKITFEYFIINNVVKTYPLNIKDLIIETLKINEAPMSSIDISNYIRQNFKKNIKIDDIMTSIITDLRYEVGLTDAKLVKYFLH